MLILLSLFPVCRAQYDKDVFMFRGRQALSDGRYADAISQFNILARLDTTDCWVFFYRGISKYNLGDIIGALITDVERQSTSNRRKYLQAIADLEIVIFI